MADFGFADALLDEKPATRDAELDEDVNPVVESAEYALKKTNLVQINTEGVKAAARHIYTRMRTESYSPRTWRTHPLHLLPPEPYDPAHPGTRAALDWLFLVSALNFSFWSAKGARERYGVAWRAGWGGDARVVWTGYWSLIAAVDRALEEDIPITDPAFYASEALCPDSLLEHVFRAAPQSTEGIPLLRERIAVLREVGFILCASFGGSFQGFLQEFQRRNAGQGTALQLVKMVTDTFPSFRDETWYDGRRVYFWKRAQILAAETWAAFYPAPGAGTHPLFPQGIDQLTMFADYRVAQIMHHLRILVYPAPLLRLLRTGAPVASGAREEVSVRAGSVVGVERVKAEIRRLAGEDAKGGGEVSSVLIDFYLWDLAKRVEGGAERIEGVETQEMVPPHRTRSIWY